MTYFKGEINMNVAITLNLTKPHEKHVDVSYKISGLDSPSFKLVFPVWSPGSYLIREYQNQVEDFRVTDASHHKIHFEKTDKCHWLIHNRKKTSIIVTYRVYASDLNVRGIYSDHEFVFINPTSAFFFPEGQLNQPVTLKINKVSSWRLDLARKPIKAVYHFVHFDDLYDTPILAAAKLDLRSFTVKKTRYVMAFWGNATAEIKKIVTDTKKIVAKEIEVFKENPCPEYHFQVLFMPGNYGGLEHSFSSTNIFDGSKLHLEEEYNKFLSLLSHEHFHLWNVKRIRPRELGPFDYTKENYSRELWMAEGITSYYDDHFLLRAKILAKEKYFKIVGENVTKLQAQRANRVNSLSESSFDAWIRFYRQNENSLNGTVSYYLKGGLIMMLLDFKIIQATNGKRSMDDLMLALYRLYKKNPKVGILRRQFLEELEKITNQPFKKFETDFINGTKLVNWKHEFAKMGLEAHNPKKSNAYFLGVILESKNNRVFVRHIAEGSPAFHSVLQPQDELIALNGKRFDDPKELDLALKNKRVKILFNRLGKVEETVIEMTLNDYANYEIKVKRKLSAKQKRYLRKFLRGSYNG